MSETLRYKTVIGVDGAYTVSTGLNVSQIIKVSRQGEQKDFGGLVSLPTLTGNQWTFFSWNKRIAFNSSFPFVGSEIIHIIYKVSV